MKHYRIGRHGDVGIDGGPLSKPMPKDAKRVDPSVCMCAQLELCAMHFVMAHGETTGHKHQFKTGNIEIFEKDGTYWIKTLDNAQISHEEHAMIAVENEVIAEIVFPQVFNPLTEEMERARD